MQYATAHICQTYLHDMKTQNEMLYAILFVLSGIFLHQLEDDVIFVIFYVKSNANEKQNIVINIIYISIEKYI